MDSFVNLIVAMLSKGMTVELKFTPTNSTNPTNPTNSTNLAPQEPEPEPVPYTKVLTEKELEEKELQELNDLLYPDKVD